MSTQHSAGSRLHMENTASIYMG